jgi:hypothetical protein
MYVYPVLVGCIEDVSLDAFVVNILFIASLCGII